MISIIFSTFNESKNLFFKNSLENFSNNKNVELIVVDGGSSDDTLKIAKLYGAKTFIALKSNRAIRYNIGLEKSIGNLIVFNHPRSTLDKSIIIDLLDFNSKKLFWGGFSHKFDKDNFFYKFTSWYSNNIRGRIFRTIYMDHCFYGSRKIFEKVSGFDEIEIFEESALCFKLNKITKPIILKNISLTSSIRFEKNGFLKQSLMNLVLKIGYYSGVSDKKMNKFYEKNLKLNQKV